MSEIIPFGSPEHIENMMLDHMRWRETATESELDKDNLNRINSNIKRILNCNGKLDIEYIELRNNLIDKIRMDKDGGDKSTK